MTVARLLAETDSLELTEWEAFDTIEPVGDQRLDILAGQITAAIVNANMVKGDPATIDGCTIKWREPDPPAEPDREAVAAQIKAGMAAFIKHQNQSPS